MKFYVSNPNLFPKPSAQEARALFAHARRSARQLVRAAAASDERIKDIVANSSDGSEPKPLEGMSADEQVAMLRNFFSAAALGAYQMSLAASASSPDEVPSAEALPFQPNGLTHFPEGALFVPVPVPVPSEAVKNAEGESSHILFESLMSSAAQQLRQFSNTARKRILNQKRRHDDLEEGEEDEEGDVEMDGGSRDMEPDRKRLRRPGAAQPAKS